jgi:phosphatidylserine/phosphatidylglycerophosphate/cardiolipin synthase-like enzyme
VGSANFTRRSLGDYDLEANLAVEMTRDAPLAQQLFTYFDTLWSNRAALGIEYTADFAAFADPSQVNYWLGRLLEGTGLSAL